MPGFKGLGGTGSFTAGMTGREARRETAEAQMNVERSAKSAGAATEQAAARQSRLTMTAAATGVLRSGLAEVLSDQMCVADAAAAYLLQSTQSATLLQCHRAFNDWQMSGPQHCMVTVHSYAPHTVPGIDAAAGGWGLAERFVAVGALSAVAGLLRDARAALPRLLPAADPQAIDRFFSRTVDAAGAGRASVHHPLC